MAKLAETYPELFEDFLGALPVPEYTQRTGFFNLATHFPSNFAVQPDLGTLISMHRRKPFMLIC